MPVKKTSTKVAKTSKKVVAVKTAPNIPKKETKANVIKEFQAHEKDTGTPQVQIAILTQRISDLQEHFQAHKKDRHSKQGLLKIVGKRRKLLDYLKKNNEAEYKKAIDKLGLRR